MFCSTSIPLFITAHPVLPRSRTVSCTSRVHRLVACCNEPVSVPNSPNLLLQSWRDSRTISSTVDLSRRFISILFLSVNCHRAAFAEKQLVKTAENYSISRRLLVLSAGLQCEPGDVLPPKVVTAAREKAIDLSEERPCASFSISDLEYYDFVIVADQYTRERLMRLAEGYAHVSGGHLSEWERKIRLLLDFNNSTSQRARNPGIPVDVPKFSTAGVDHSMDIIKSGCESIVRSLLAAGL